ncbi:MAG: flavin reductase family protein [Chloroflexota bacterium]
MQDGKLDFDLSLFSRLLYPRHVVLATCTNEQRKPNILPLSFSMPVSYSPPIVVISVGLTKYSHGLIEETGEFVINVPTRELAQQTWLCGTATGREMDKFREAGLTPLPARKVSAPLIKECIGHLECRVRTELTAGDHTLFVADVVAACVDDGVFDYVAEFPDFDTVSPLLAPLDLPRREG